MYIRSFTFARDVPIRIDYSAKYMDLAHGAVAGILSGLTSLNCSELTLKKVHYRNGISGLDKLITLLVTEWLTDIRQNQIPRITFTLTGSGDIDLKPIWTVPVPDPSGFGCNLQ